MQFTIVALLVAATGVIASPWAPPPPHKPQPPQAPQVQNTNAQVSTINCASGSPYCCNLSADQQNGKNTAFTCTDFNGGCNSIAVCCNNQNQQEVTGGKQTCLAFGNANVEFK